MDLETLNFAELRDAEIVSRMRSCNYEKFKTLVRMHLSFELDLNTDEFDLPCHEIVYEDKGKLKKWNRLSKKHKHGGVMAAALATGSAGCASAIGSVSGGGGGSHKSGHSGSATYASGSPIEGLHQQIDAGFLFHLQELKEFLMLDKNLQQEGIFRKTGSASRQNDLRSQIQNDKPLDLEASGYSAHDCATVFKGYLAELPEPLLTDAHYPAHLQIAPLCMGINHHMDNHLNKEKTSSSSCNSERSKKELHVLNSIQLLLLLLPDENRQLLQNIIDMLHAVALQQSINKMGPDNLATLFAPHLICPRNLPPEALHYLARKMSSMIAYMIVRGQDIFSVPAKLATDIRAYFLERKRKKTMSPEMLLDDSISDISTVNTVYTFVDREKTAAATTKNNTDTELAQLYAHIQSMPESSKKRRLIKQFNKQNGQGTPLQLQAMNRLKNSETSRTAKSLSDSIKKHIFHKGIMSRTPKRPANMPTIVLETPNNSSMKHHKQRVLFQSPNPQKFSTNPSSSLYTTTTTSSSSAFTSCSLTTSVTNATPCNNLSTPYNIKSHPLQKSISSSSLLMQQQQQQKQHPYSINMMKRPLPKKSLNEDQESSMSSSSASSSSSYAYGSNTNNYSNDGGFVCKTKSISAPVSRQTSSDLQNHNNNSMTSTSSSTSSTCLSSNLPNHLDPNCCVTPLKLISEAAKQLIVGGGAAIDKKSVAWDDSHIEHLSNPSTPLKQTPSTDLKSRYKSEPNLSLSNICDTPTSSSMAYGGGGGYEMITPIAKHMTGKSLTRKLMKGVSMGNLKFPFSTPESTKRLVRTVVSSKLKRRSSDDSQIYQQAEGSFAAAIKSGNAPLLLDMDDNDLDDDDTFEDEPHGVDCGGNASGASETEDDLDDDHYSEHVSLIATGARSSSSSELNACFSGGGGAVSYQQLLLHQSSLYHRNLDLVTSTPSLLMGRRSMSPITKSTQRMPKAMQESIMTPRSRKPVMVLTTTTGSTDQNQTDISNFNERANQEEPDDEEEAEEEEDVDTEEEDGEELDDDENDERNESISGVITKSKSLDIHTSTTPHHPPQPEIINEDATSLGGYSDIFKRQQLLQANQSFVQQASIALGLSSDDSNSNTRCTKTKDNTRAQNINNADELSKHFKEYLLTRSVLTAPPEDASFTSHSDDFDSSHEIEELDDENQLSSSLLYCLDGNRPDPANDTDATSTTDTLNEQDSTTHTGNGQHDQDDDDNDDEQNKFPEFTSAIAGSSRNTTSISHMPIITTNRLATNPFVILNNARKRAASNDLDKMSSALFNSHHYNNEQHLSGLKSFEASMPTTNTNLISTRHQQFSPQSQHKHNLNFNSTNASTSSNKENCEHNENYVVTKKLLISRAATTTTYRNRSHDNRLYVPE